MVAALLAAGATVAWADAGGSGGGDPPAPAAPASPQDIEIDRSDDCLHEHGLGFDPATDSFTLANKPVELKSDEMRELMFVTCRPQFDISGPFVVGFEPSEFVRCVRAQGFDLPDPVQQGDEWVLDLAGGGIDPNSAEWNRAAFVTCGPRVSPDRP
jgi:hypothetical protein